MYSFQDLVGHSKDLIALVTCLAVIGSWAHQFNMQFQI